MNSDVQDALAELQRSLAVAADRLCRLLETALPQLAADWWTDKVLMSLSDQERWWVQRRGFTSLAELDLAALLRVMHGNWYELSQELELPAAGRKCIDDVQRIRNWWAHMSANPPLRKIRGALESIGCFLRLIDAHQQHTAPQPSHPVPETRQPIDPRSRVAELAEVCREMHWALTPVDFDGYTSFNRSRGQSRICFQVNASGRITVKFVLKQDVLSQTWGSWELAGEGFEGVNNYYVLLQSPDPNASVRELLPLLQKAWDGLEAAT